MERDTLERKKETGPLRITRMFRAKRHLRYGKYSSSSVREEVQGKVRKETQGKT